MKNFSNKYIFIYATILVAVVAVLLSVVAMGLKDRKDANVRNEKMQKLLAAIEVNVEATAATEEYAKYFTEEYNVNTNGEIVAIYDVVAGEQKQGEVRPFNVALKAEQDKEKVALGSGAFPVYCYSKDGKTGYVLPLYGAGLWGPVWGYMSIADDCNTVQCVVFDHAGETPGLGAEIVTEKFTEPFKGKQIMDENGIVVSIAVIRNAGDDNIHAVDALSGGTMTSNGVSDMLKTDMARYQKFFDNVLAQSNAMSEAVVTEIENAAIEGDEACANADEQGKEAK